MKSTRPGIKARLYALFLNLLLILEIMDYGE